MTRIRRPDISRKPRRQLFPFPDGARRTVQIFFEKYGGPTFEMSSIARRASRIRGALLAMEDIPKDFGLGFIELVRSLGGGEGVSAYQAKIRQLETEGAELDDAEMMVYKTWNEVGLHYNRMEAQVFFWIPSSDAV